MAAQVLALRNGNSADQQAGRLQLGTQKRQEHEDVITISDEEAQSEIQPEKGRGSGFQKRPREQNSSSEEASSSGTKKPRLQFLPKSNSSIDKSNSSTEVKKPFSCHICERTFSVRGELKTHIESGRHQIVSQQPKLQEIITLSDDEDETEAHVVESGYDGDNEKSDDDDAEDEDVDHEDVDERQAQAQAQDQAQRLVTSQSRSDDESEDTSPYSRKSEVIMVDDYEDYLRRQESERNTQIRQSAYSSTSYSENEEQSLESFSQRLNTRLFGDVNLEPESFETFCERLNINRGLLGNVEIDEDSDVNSLVASPSNSRHEDEDDLEDDDIWITEQW